MISKLLTLLVVAGAVAAVVAPSSASAATPESPAVVQTYTGCLNRLNVIVQVAVGDSPATPPCRDAGAQIVHFAGGDLTSLTAGTGLTGGGANGDVSIALAPGFRLPQTCAANQGTTWNGSGWICASLTSQAAFDSLVSLLGTSGTINQGSNPVHWTKLKGVPAGFADGTDDTGPSYSAGFGLNLTGTTFSADPAQLQRRVSEDCATGSAIRSVHDDGTVACETVSSGGWSLTGNAGTNSTNFIGTTDDQPLNLKVNGQRGLRLEPRPESPNLVGGNESNGTGAGAYGATIAGGGSSTFPNIVNGAFSTVGGGLDNSAQDLFASVAGGRSNLADGGQATIGGGSHNVASGRATVSGGEGNQASGFASMIPGGQFNHANGTYSFAAGVGAHADHDGSFVWADTSAESLSSTGPNQFVVRATGGLHLSGGPFVCAGCISGGDLSNSSVSTDKLSDGAVTEGKLGFDPTTQVEFDSFAQLLSGVGTINNSGNPVEWTKLKNVPNVIADPSQLQRRVSGACATGEAVRAVHDDGTVACEVVGSGGDGPTAYCALAQANPLSFPDAPCRARSEPLDSGGDVGEHSSLAIGTDGNPVISYFDITQFDLKVARCNDPACTGANEMLSTVDSTGLVGEDTSLTIGTDGNPVISYYDRTNFDLKVARCNDPACTGANEMLSTVDSTGDVGNYASLAIGIDGNPVISYYDRTNRDLKVARCNDPSCSGANETLSTVDSAGIVGVFQTSLAIGSDGNPVISYYDATNGDLKVARCNDPSCANETLNTVDSAGDVGLYSSLAIGTDGNPVISYLDGTNVDLKVARCNDPACTGTNETLSTVDSAGSVGFQTSLAIGTDRNPVISYSDQTNGDLKVARCNDPACTGTNETLSTVDSAGSVGIQTSLAIGTDGNPVISHYDLTNGDLKIARPPVSG